MFCSSLAVSKQRVAIARALASEAKVLLADEPTGNLDEDTAQEIIELLKRTAHEHGKCVIVVTHSKTLANEAMKFWKSVMGRCTSVSSFREAEVNRPESYSWPCQ